MLKCCTRGFLAWGKSNRESGSDRRREGGWGQVDSFTGSERSDAGEDENCSNAASEIQLIERKDEGEKRREERN